MHPDPTRRPAVWSWFVAYCAVMVLIYLLVAAAGVFFLVADPAMLDTEPAEAKAMGLIMIALGLVFAAPFAAAPFLPRRPWVWVYGIVLIALGMTSVCTLPAAIPLLVYWINAETKAWFGRP
ncbi:MAG TPA: hypothetical protein VF746_24745 [Longimicrobium sp.]